MGENHFVLFNIDGDEFCLIDLVKDVEKGCGIKRFKIQWMCETVRAYIGINTQLMNM